MKYLKYYKTLDDYNVNKNQHIDPTVSLVEGVGIYYSEIEIDDDYNPSDCEFDDYNSSECFDDSCSDCEFETSLPNELEY